MTTTSEQMKKKHRTPSDRTGSSLARFLVLGCFAAMFLVPVIYYGLGSELARWTQARAQLQLDAGNPDEAIRLLERAIAQSPGDQPMKLHLAMMLMKNDRAADALELIKQVLAVADDPTQPLQAMADCLIYLNRADEALETVKVFAEERKPARLADPDRLNFLAYFQALAGKELQRADRNINLAIDSAAAALWWMDGEPMRLEDQTLVAAAVISRTVGHQDQVLELLNIRVELFENGISRTQQKLSARVYDELQIALPFEQNQEAEIRKFTVDVHYQKKFLAILYSVRALLHQDLGNNENRDQDRWSVNKLGYDSEELLKPIRDDWQLLTGLERQLQYLDTRAVVEAARRQYSSALHDANLAILAAGLLNATFTGTIQNTIRDESGTWFNPSQRTRTEATLLKHRSEILQSLGHRSEAESDLRRIEELGFDRDEILF